MCNWSNSVASFLHFTCSMLLSLNRLWHTKDVEVTAGLSRLLFILQVPPHSRASFCLAHFISFVSSPRWHWGNRLDLSCSPKPKWGKLWSRWCPLLNTMCFSFAHTSLTAESESLVGVGLRLTLWVAECYCPSALRSKPLSLQSTG